MEQACCRVCFNTAWKESSLTLGVAGKGGTTLKSLQLIPVPVWVWDLQCKLIFTRIKCWIKEKDVHLMETGLRLG